MTRLLNTYSGGDRAAGDRLMSLVYDDLRAIASRVLSRESKGHTLQATDLVNESFLKLVNQTEVNWQGKTHFFAVSAQAMRRILVDHARTKHRQKRGGHRRRVELKDDFVLTADQPDETLALDEAITRLQELNPDHAKMVECRFFGGLGNAEIAALLGVTTRTVERHWAMVRAWLRRELEKFGPA